MGIISSLVTKAKPLAATVSRKAVTNAPMLLMASTGIGMLVLTITAYRAGKKAYPKLKEAEEAKGEPLTTMEKVKVTAPCWGPVVGGLIINEASNFMSWKIGDNRLEAMKDTANALLASNNELREEISMIHKESPEIVEKIESQKIEDATKSETKIPIVELGERTLTSQEECDIYKTGYGEELFYDAYTGVMFKSSKQEVQSGIMRFEKQWVNSKFGLKVSDLYKCLHVVRGGMMLEASGYPKACKSDFDKYEVPAIDLEYRTFRIEDPVTGEYEPDTKGYYVIMYFPTGIDADYLLSVDKKMTSIDDLTMDEELLGTFI